MTRLASRRTLRVIAAMLAGVVGGLLALALSPASSGTVGPGTMSLHALPSRVGSSSLALPPFGEVTAMTHSAPLRLELHVDQLDIEALQDALESADPETALRRDVEHDLAPLLRKLAFHSLVASLLGGLVAAAVLPKRAPHRFLVASGSALAVVGSLLAWSWASFDQAAFEHATFVGPIERAPAVLATAQRRVEGLAEVRDRVEVLARQVSAVYAAIESEPVDETGTKILHVSDIHSNPLGLEIVQQLATAFDVDAVLDTGDLTSFGSPIESRIIDLIADLDVPYLFVPGNHDSVANRAAIGAAPGVMLLNGDVVTVGDVRVMGVADPTFTASNEIGTEEGNDRRVADAPRVATAVRRLAPDVLAVHDLRHGSASTGLVPLIVAGHTHRRAAHVVDGTLELVVGSTGATGLGAFTIDSDLPYEAELLRFDGDRLIAVDHVTLDGVTGEFGVERELIDATFTAPEVDRPGVR